MAHQTRPELAPLTRSLSAPFLGLESGSRVPIIHNHVQPWRRLTCLPAAVVAGFVAHFLWEMWSRNLDSFAFSCAIVGSLVYVGIVALWLWQLFEPEHVLIFDRGREQFEVWVGRFGLFQVAERIPLDLITGLEIETTRCRYCRAPVSCNSERLIHGTDLWLTLRNDSQVFCGEFDPLLAEGAVKELRSLHLLDRLVLEHHDGPLPTGSEDDFLDHCDAEECVLRAGQEQAVRQFFALPAQG